MLPSMDHKQKAGDLQASACRADEEFGEDPLLPQKALPLPENLGSVFARLSRPDEVVAAATSAMEACDALPEGAAEHVMQPLAEAYLFAVRREAQLLPKVVSAVSAKSVRRQSSTRNASPLVVDNFSASKEASSGVSRSNASPASGCLPDFDGKEETVDKTKLSVCTRMESATASSSVSTDSRRPRNYSSKKNSLPRVGNAAFVSDETSAKSYAFVVPSFSEEEDFCDGTSDDRASESASPSAGLSVAQSLSDLRTSEKTKKKGATEDELSSVSETSANGRSDRDAESATSLAELRCAPESYHKKATAAAAVGSTQEIGRAAPGHTQHTSGHDVKGKTHAEDSFGVDEQFSAIAAEQLQQSAAPAAGIFNNDASPVGPKSAADSLEKNGEDAAVSMGNAQFASAAAYVAADSCRRRPTTEKKKPLKEVREKRAAYVDQLLLLDKQREAASASAGAPAAAWRAAALEQFKTLRDCVYNGDLVSEEQQQVGFGSECLSWSEQEWQLYCRCYPPSVDLLAACDTVTLCQLLFLLVEDVKQQQHVIIKTEKKRRGSTSTSASCCGDRTGVLRSPQGKLNTKAEKEQSFASSPRNAYQQRWTGDAEQGKEGLQILQTQTQQQRGGEAEGTQGQQESLLDATGGGHRQDCNAAEMLQYAAEGGVGSSMSADDERDTGYPGTKQALVKKDAGGMEYRVCDEEKYAQEKAKKDTFGEGSCACCRYGDCCVTLQQASWLFGVLVFLDEIQAMDPDVASCMQQLRRCCEEARERVIQHRLVAQQQVHADASAAHAAETETAGEARKLPPAGDEKRIATWVPADLVAALNLLIVVINDFFNQR